MPGPPIAPPALAAPDIALAIAYAPIAARRGLTLLFALDERLAAIHAAARDPAIGLLRLAWWRDALVALDQGSPPAEPLLRAIAGALVPEVAGAELAAIAEGWGVLLEAPLDDAALVAHARDRGARLFELAARILGGPAPGELSRAGQVWGLVDIGRRTGAATTALARARIGNGEGGRWPVALRPLGMIAALAAGDACGAPAGAVLRLSRMIGHRITGRTGLGAAPRPA